MKPTKNSYGYLQLSLCNVGKIKKFRVHRLVCLAFLENPKNLPLINHKNEIKSDNRVENLEFCTARYNSTYNNIHIKRGEKRKGKKHSEQTKQKMSKSSKGKGTKPIIQLDLQNNFIRVWDSALSASKELNIDNSSITKCCKSKLKSAGGFIWKYK